MSKQFSMLPVFLLLVIGVSCSSSKNEEIEMTTKPEITYIKIGYKDASVPPEYHRSYDLVFTQSQIEIRVNSYGDILVDTFVQPADYKFSKCIKLINEFKVMNSNITAKEDDGCTGGTGLSITIGNDQKQKVNGYNYFCGGDSYGDLTGDIQSFRKALIAFIPNFTKFTQ